MTIDGLWLLLEKENAIEEKCITELRGQTLAVDLGGWIVQGRIGWDSPRAQLLLVYRRLRSLLLLGTNVIGVLDSERPPDDKRNRFGQRPRFRGYDPRIPQVFRALGCQCLVASGEAEALCAALQRKNVVSAVLTDDGDALAYGATRLYRIESTRSATFKQVIAQRPQKTYAAIALLSGSDFHHKGVKFMGPKKTIKLVDNIARDAPHWGFADLQARVPQLRDQAARAWNEYMSVPSSPALTCTWEPMDETEVVKLLPQKIKHTLRQMRGLDIERRFRNLPCAVYDLLQPVRVIKGTTPVKRVVLRLFPMRAGSGCYDVEVSDALLKGTAEGHQLLKALLPSHLHHQRKITDFFPRKDGVNTPRTPRSTNGTPDTTETPRARSPKQAQRTRSPGKTSPNQAQRAWSPGKTSPKQEQRAWSPSQKSMTGGIGLESALLQRIRKIIASRTASSSTVTSASNIATREVDTIVQAPALRRIIDLDEYDDVVPVHSNCGAAQIIDLDDSPAERRIVGSEFSLLGPREPVSPIGGQCSMSITAAAHAFTGTTKRRRLNIPV